MTLKNVKTIFITMALSMAVSTLLINSANAQIAGHNVIVIPGFNFDDLVNPPSDEEVYSRDKMNVYWREKSEGKMNWSTAERIEGRISEQIFTQAKEISRLGTCDDGCVLVVHSTGDQVARHFLENQEAWFKGTGLAPLNILTTLDFAGAGGGTDLADYAVSIVSSSIVPSWIKDIVGDQLGVDLTSTSNLGVVQDLSYSGARAIAPSNNDIPRLRFSASGGSWLVGQLVSGADDGQIPASSSCGASSPTSIDSCSNSLAYDGKRTSKNGPDGLMYNHFPILMSSDYDHNQIMADISRGRSTPVLDNKDVTFAGILKTDFATYTKNVSKWKFWLNTGKFRWVEDSYTTSMSKIIYDTLNN